MEREEPTMQTKILPIDKIATIQSSVQDHPEEPKARTPQAFYEKMVKRSDVREILTRLARMDREEKR